MHSILLLTLLLAYITNTLAISHLSHRDSHTHDQQEKLLAPPQGITFYMTMKTQKQGDIKGPSTVRGREQQIPVISIQHEIISPRDPASGLPTGRRQHKPLTIIKEIDKSTPSMYTALVNNENLVDVDIHAWKQGSLIGGRGGAETNIYSIQLTNANIASMSINEDGRLVMTLTYQKIQFTWKEGGIIMTEDDWEARVERK